MWSKLVVAFVAILGAAIQSNGQNIKIEFKNFTSLNDALHDAERFMLAFNETYNFPSLSVGLSVRGKTVLRKAWGLVDLENNVPVSLRTHYRIASISKTITSAIVGGLVERGLLHYDDPISKYLNESLYPSKQWNNQTVPITIRQLLSHTGGTHVTAALSEIEQGVAVQNVKQSLAQFKNEPLHFKPGTKFSYSNYGFQLLGAVVESVTNKPYQQVMAEFFHQHKLSESYARNVSVVIHDIARYYVSHDPANPRANTPTVPFDDLVFVQGYWPAGGAISTVDDLLHYGQLLIDSYKGRPNAIVSRKTLDQMWTSQTGNMTTPHPIESDYGLGWLVARPNAQLKHQHLVWHAGGLIGATSLLVVYPDEEIVGVALTNKGSVRALPQMILQTVENVYHLVK